MIVLLNYTPHNINILDDNNNILRVIPSNGEARCDKSTQRVGIINDIPVNTVIYSDVSGLPDQRPNTYIIVSLIVATALSGVRNDLLVVDNVVRDGSTVLGCKAFSRI